MGISSNVPAGTFVASLVPIQRHLHIFFPVQPDYFCPVVGCTEIYFVIGPSPTSKVCVCVHMCAHLFPSLCPLELHPTTAFSLSSCLEIALPYFNLPCVSGSGAVRNQSFLQTLFPHHLPLPHRINTTALNLSTFLNSAYHPTFNLAYRLFCH